MIDAVYIIGAMILSLYLCLKVRWLCERKGMINEVNERSSHKNPTLRGGGLGIVLTVVPASFIVVFGLYCSLVNMNRSNCIQVSFCIVICLP